MDCTETQKRLSEFRDGLLPSSDAEAVSAHLSACAECASVAESLDVLRDRLRGLAPDPAPPELRARVRAAIGAEAGGIPGSAGPRGAGARPYFSRRWLPLEAAAAVLLFASVYWYQRTQPPDATAPPPPSAVEKPAPSASEKSAPDTVRPRETADRRDPRAPRASAGESVRFVPEGGTGARYAGKPGEEAAPSKMPKARDWSPADLPAAPAVRASTDSGRIVPATVAPPPPQDRETAASASAGIDGKRVAEAEGMRKAQEGRALAAPPSRLLRPVPYGREVLLEVGAGQRDGVEERIAAAARRLGGGSESPDRASAGVAEGAAAVRVLLPEPSAAAFLEELGRLGTIPPEGRPAAIDTPAGPRAGTVAYTVRIRVR
ncbi:MAG: zf-HC2 domain-containing protein [Deltaproteobacteria bacterium]|nr:zf-HC2 domain-containing protein [Deltaproteobacteria bacterium]